MTDRPTTEPPWWSWDTEDDDSWLAEFSGEDVRALVRERNRLLAEAAQGAAPRAEGLPVERLARAIKSRYGLKESESEVSIFLNAIFGSGEAGHD